MPISRKTPPSDINRSFYGTETSMRNVVPAIESGRFDVDDNISVDSILFCSIRLNAADKISPWQ